MAINTLILLRSKWDQPLALIFSNNSSLIGAKTGETVHKRGKEKKEVPLDINLVEKSKSSKSQNIVNKEVQYLVKIGGPPQAFDLKWIEVRGIKRGLSLEKNENFQGQKEANMRKGLIEEDPQKSQRGTLGADHSKKEAPTETLKDLEESKSLEK